MAWAAAAARAGHRLGRKHVRCPTSITTARHAASVLAMGCSGQVTMGMLRDHPRVAEGMQSEAFIADLGQAGSCCSRNTEGQAFRVTDIP